MPMSWWAQEGYNGGDPDRVSRGPDHSPLLDLAPAAPVIEAGAMDTAQLPISCAQQSTGAAVVGSRVIKRRKRKGYYESSTHLSRWSR